MRLDPLVFPCFMRVRRPAAASTTSTPLPAPGPLSSTASCDVLARQIPPLLPSLSRPHHALLSSKFLLSSTLLPHHRLASETVAHRPFRPPRHPFRPGTVARRPIRHSIPSPHRAAVHRHNDGAVPARLWPRARPPPVKGPTPVDGQ
jgi:hypothetical protein